MVSPMLHPAVTWPDANLVSQVGALPVSGLPPSRTQAPLRMSVGSTCTAQVRTGSSAAKLSALPPVDELVAFEAEARRRVGSGISKSAAAVDEPRAITLVSAACPRTGCRSCSHGSVALATPSYSSARRRCRTRRPDATVRRSALARSRSPGTSRRPAPGSSRGFVAVEDCFREPRASARIPARSARPASAI